MKILTIAYGSFYREVALRGFINSLKVKNDLNNLVVYLDQSPTWELPDEVEVNVIDEHTKSIISNPNATFFDRTSIKFRFLSETLRTHQTGVCWVDCDSLVIENLESNINERVINFMRHGSCDSDEKFDCGKGLIVKGEDFIVGGVFYLPNLECAKLLEDLAVERKNWAIDESAYWYRDGEQCLLNHLGYRYGKEFVWLDKFNNLYNWEFLENRHPVPFDKGLRALKFKDEFLFAEDARKVAVLSWSSLTLRRHIKQGFITIGFSKSCTLRNYYSTSLNFPMSILYSVYDLFYVKLFKKL